MKKVILLLLTIILVSCNSSAQDKKEAKVFPITKTKKEWKAQLTSEQYNVLRKAGTEARWSSPFNTNHEEGVYVCAACDTPLFKSKDKFESGSGWPSFDREIKGNVEFDVDYNLGYARSEEHCATCGGHLGHVFQDGPRETTGKRHCINGVALKFIPKKDE
ncbi:MAG: peptide-methionine (R)-S-oxide reductase MsrB [Flavobacteriaceae bacterium]|nr:peptide-methionine (R)-S-oxide reductase MsrB [Flavobacteriaceae bacterium]